jgi:hypothetical protein
LCTPLEEVPRKAPCNCRTLGSFVKLKVPTAEGGVPTPCVLFSVEWLPLLFTSPVDVELPHGWVEVVTLLAEAEALDWSLDMIDVFHT